MNLNKERIYKEIKEEYDRFKNNEFNSYSLLKLYYKCKLLNEYGEYEYEEEIEEIQDKVENHFVKTNALYEGYSNLFNDFIKLLPCNDNLAMILNNKRHEIDRRLY